MSLRNQLTVLAIVIIALAITFASVFLVSMKRLDTVESSQQGYSDFRREITSLRDLIFQYVMTRDPADAARVADRRRGDSRRTERP
jgi:hypothetical protein